MAAPAAPSLADSPSAWRQIVNSAADTAIISLDAQGRVTTWSTGSTRLLGWDEAEMLGQDLGRIFTEEDRAQGRLAAEMADALQTGRGGGGEGWRLRKDGSRVWAVGEMSPIFDDAGQHLGFVKVLRDRTAQMRVERALRAETAALELLNRAGSALAQETDVERLVQIVTDAGVQLTGAQYGAFFRQAPEAAEGPRFEFFTAAGAAVDTASTLPLPRNTHLLQATFDEGAIVRANDVTKDPRYGRNAPHHGVPEGHVPVRSYLAVPVASRSGQVLGGLLFGHERAGVFDVRAERLVGGLAAEAAVAIDNALLAQQAQRELAERRRAEEALRDLNATLEQQVAERTSELERNAEALRHAQKMEAVGQLTGGVAHDFNNLLQVVLGNLELVRRIAPPEAARLHRAVHSAMNGARRAAALTERLLAFARRQPLNPRPLDANALIRGMAELLHRTLGETVVVRTQLAPGLWLAEADPNALENAILNLAVNARDAMPDGGTLTITTANLSFEQADAERAAGDYVQLAVADTGMGMSEATLARVFEPFFTTKPVGKGTGLGLSQVYGFAKQSRGHVGIRSAPGQGTTVEVLLPRHAGAPLHEAAGEDVPVPAGAQRETVLVVEDDADVRSHSAESLRELGYHVLETPDGPAALRLLQQDPLEVHLLFTDVVLPGGLSGAQVAQMARALRPGLKVLFTTGYARDAIVHDGRLDPGVQLLPKPFSFAALAAKVREVLDARA